MQNNAVDLAQLNRYTGGDTVLNAEILRLFRDQSEGLLAGLPAILDEGDGRAWYQVMHTLKGAARGIGAFDLADSAACAEKLELGQEHDRAIDALRLLESHAQAVKLFINAQLG